VIKVGDILIASGYAEGESDFETLVSGVKEPFKKEG
jgi:hypothetical protein